MRPGPSLGRCDERAADAALPSIVRDDERREPRHVAFRVYRGKRVRGGYSHDPALNFCDKGYSVPSLREACQAARQVVRVGGIAELPKEAGDG